MVSGDDADSARPRAQRSKRNARAKYFKMAFNLWGARSKSALNDNEATDIDIELTSASFPN